MLCQAILFTILLNFAASEEDRFFWENDYVGKPVNFYHGAAYQIPVIEGEKVMILCKVRAVSEDSYKIIWDYESFHATTTGKTVLVNNTSGDEFAQDTITVNIDNPTDIDDKDIICSWENGQFSDTITLQFKVYVPDNLDNSEHCNACEGIVQLKLKRPKDQRKEDTNLEEKIREKVLKEYDVTDVQIGSNGYICACKREQSSTTKTTSTTERRKPATKRTTTTRKPTRTTVRRKPVTKQYMFLRIRTQCFSEF